MVSDELEGLTVADLMTAQPLTVRASDPLTRVHELMFNQGIRHVPVVDTEGNLEGLVTHRDLVRSALFAFDDLPYSEQRAYAVPIRLRERAGTIAWPVLGYSVVVRPSESRPRSAGRRSAGSPGAAKPRCDLPG